MVYTPAELIINFGSLRNQLDYQPSRYSGTGLKIKIPKVEDLKIISEQFFLPLKEKKKEFENKVKFCLTDLNTCRYVITYKGNNIAFYTLANKDGVFEINFCRFIQDTMSRTLMNQIIHNFIISACNNSKTIIYIKDINITEELKEVLAKYGFLRINGEFYKYVSRDTTQIKDLATYLEKKIDEKFILEAYKKTIGSLLKEHSLDDLTSILKIERYLWPLKFIESGLQCYIVPIQPQWAMHLFNVRIAEQDLFGADQTLLFNRENVYYRSSKPRLPKEGSRILWYVSVGSNKYEGVMEIAATSYVNSIEINKPKILYKKYSRLGVYKWEEVFKKANYDLEKEIMAFNFDLTETFNNPVKRQLLDEIYFKMYERNFSAPQAPLKIDESLYFEIIKAGF